MNAQIPDRKTTRLQDGNILLRPYNGKDAEDLHKAISSSISEMSPWLPFAHEGYDIKESKTWIKGLPAAWKKGESFNFAICDLKTGAIIGGCGINAISWMDKHANLGYWVRSDRMGHGVAVAATKLLAKWSFEAVGMKRLEIVVAVDNARSLRVAEKVGAKPEGVLRNRFDLHGKAHNAVMHSLIPEDL